MTHVTNDGFGFEQPDAYLFDVDGVLTPTASVHQQAWKAMFDEVLDEPFTGDDYLRFVDGRSRVSGIRAMLESRGITASDELIDTYAERKNNYFLEIISSQGVAPFPDAVKIIDHLLRIGARLAVVSSSRNARTVLESAGLSDRFEAWVDGEVAAAEGLAGKPAPDMFWRAADLLGIAYNKCVVVEDAEAGVAAGAAGNFAAVVGVDRVGNAEALVEAGADLVVTDLGELEFGWVFHA